MQVMSKYDQGLDQPGYINPVLFATLQVKSFKLMQKDKVIVVEKGYIFIC